MNISAIDIGSNSLRLMVGQETVSGFRFVATHAITTQLIQGIRDNGMLQGLPMRRSLRAVAKLVVLAQSYHAPKPRLAATESLRAAANRQLLIDLVMRRHGLSIEVLSAEEEAALTFASVRNNIFPMGELTVADLGGGSLEIASGSGDSPESWSGYPLGCVTLTATHLSNEPPGIDAWERTRIFARTVLRERLAIHGTLVGCGGAFTSVADMSIGLSRNQDAPLRGYRLEHSSIIQSGRFLASLPSARRALLPGISRARAPLAPAGTAIIAALLDLSEGWCLVSDRGFAWGLLLDTWARSKQR